MGLGNSACLCVISQVVDESFELIEVLNTVDVQFVFDNMLYSVKNDVDSWINI